jgi:hypothetical protein
MNKFKRHFILMTNLDVYGLFLQQVEWETMSLSPNGFEFFQLVFS